MVPPPKQPLNGKKIIRINCFCILKWTLNSNQRHSWWRSFWNSVWEQCAQTSYHPPSSALLWHWGEQLVGTRAGTKYPILQNVGVMHLGHFSNSLKDQHRSLSLFCPPQAIATSLTTVIRRFEDTHIFGFASYFGYRRIRKTL